MFEHKQILSYDFSLKTKTMKYLIFTLTLTLLIPTAKSDSTIIEHNLSSQCSKGDLLSCESLAVLFLKDERWDNAQQLGEAICKKNIPVGCTIKGLSLLKNKNVSEGTRLLNLACDQFEPYSCRSLGRLIKASGDKTLSHVYFRKACHFGLKEVCQDLQRNKKILDDSGHQFLKKLSEDCYDTKSSACKERLQSLSQCEKILNKKDCLIIPGLLTIFFRAKLIQAEAKGLLTQIVLGEKKLREDKKFKGYSFELSTVLKNLKPRDNYHYIFGFNKLCSGKAKATSIELYPKAYLKMNSKSLNSIKKEFNKGKKQDCYDSRWGFEAYAMASLDPLHPEHLDIWKINQDGNLIQINDGSPIQK